MKKDSIDGVFLIGDYNRNYLSGFTGNESFSFITEKEAIFITDSRYTEQAGIQVKDYEIVQYSNNIFDFVADLIDKHGIEKLGIEEDIISLANYNCLKGKTKCDLVPLKGMIENIRIIKDSVEIEAIRKAAQMADRAFQHMVEFIKVGMREIEVALELEFYLKKLGAKELSFPSIVASGVRSSLPHGEPTDKVIGNGEFLTLDFGCIFNEYCSDMTRTVVLGEPNNKMVEIYNIVKEAQIMALESIKPNVPVSEVDLKARNYISDKGYGEYFGHNLGHGVGRQIHEAPKVSRLSDVILQSGMIITDEPGIYIPDFGGVRIEDLVLVTDTGYEILSKSTKELIVL